MRFYMQVFLPCFLLMQWKSLFIKNKTKLEDMSGDFWSSACWNLALSSLYISLHREPLISQMFQHWMIPGWKINLLEWNHSNMYLLLLVPSHIPGLTPVKLCLSWIMELKTVYQIWSCEPWSLYGPLAITWYYCLQTCWVCSCPLCELPIDPNCSSATNAW